MSDLPKPAFVSEEERKKTEKASKTVGDTTKETVEKAVPLGTLILDSPFAHVRYLKQEDLLYHIFRGPAVPKRFWGTGTFGLCVLAAAEAVWPYDFPKVEYMHEVCRQEVYADDPKKMPQYPAHFYSGYLCLIPAIDRKVFITEERIIQYATVLDDKLKKALEAWQGEN